MDPLTQRLLERTRARREDLAKKMAAQNADTPAKRKAPLAPNSSLNTLPAGHAAVSGNALKSNNTHQEPSPKTAMKGRFNMLAAQRAQWDVEQEGKELDSSPVLPQLRTRQSVAEDQPKATPTAPTRKNRFAALAANINSWENDMHHPSLTPMKEATPAKKWQRPAPQVAQAEESRPTPAKRETRPDSVIKPRSPIKQSMQGAGSTAVVSTNQHKPQSGTPVMSRAARYQLGSSRLGDSNFHASTTKNVVLPQAKKCTAVNEVPQRSQASVRLEAPAPCPSPRTTAGHPNGPSPKKRPGEDQEPVTASKKQAIATVVTSSKKVPAPGKEAPCKGASGREAPADILSPTRVEPRVGAMAKSIHDRLKAHQSNWQSNEISKKIQEDRMKDMAVLKGRWAKTGGEVRKETQPRQQQQEEESKMEESREEESESGEEDDGEVFMETDIDGASESVHQDDSGLSANNESSIVSTVNNQSGDQEHRETEADNDRQEESDADDEDEEESDVNLTDVLGDIDELIVEAEQAMAEEKQKGAQKPPAAVPEPTIQQQVEAVSHSRPQPPPETTTQTVKPEPTPAARPPKPVAAERQPPQQQSRSQPKTTQRVVRADQIKRAEQEQQQNDQNRRTKTANAEKIQILMNEVSTQQSIINQTSQALSLIAANESLRNTVEEIEAEKMMVISNQKRQACLSEIQYLKSTPPKEASHDRDGSPTPKGHISIKDIKLPFKTEYIMDLQSNKEMPSHYYFIVSRCNAQVTATNLLNTRENLTGDCLQFSTEVEINNLESDFGIELLVYQLRSTVTRIEGMAERAVHPVVHAKGGVFGSLTPKKLRKQAAKQQRSSRSSVSSSQGGSQPVRSCTFAIVGSGRLTLASCGTTKFMLSRVPLTSPLEGSIHLCMSCRKNSSIVMKGFLTMFDEISGLGSWHRRWCTLTEGYITYWKYPDDEKRKPPIGSIDLRECITKEVAQISRILCARPNTFELVTSRPASRYEKDTLISTCNNSVLTTKHMLSADVKEERLEWIDALNRTLVDLRMWNKDAAVPTE